MRPVLPGVATRERLNGARSPRGQPTRPGFKALEVKLPSGGAPLVWCVPRSVATFPMRRCSPRLMFCSYSYTCSHNKLADYRYRAVWNHASLSLVVRPFGTRRLLGSRKMGSNANSSGSGMYSYIYFLQGTTTMAGPGGPAWLGYCELFCGQVSTLLDNHEVIYYSKKKTKSRNQGEPMIHTPSCSIRLVEVLPITKADEKWLEQELTGIG